MRDVVEAHDFQHPVTEEQLDQVRIDAWVARELVTSVNGLDLETLARRPPMRCGRCTSGDLSTTDLPAGVRVVCFTCGWVMLKDKPE